MKFSQNRKAVLLVLSLALLIAVGVGGTLAFLTDKTDEVQNTFTPTSVGTHVQEDEFDGKTKTNVKIRNTGDINAYVRAMVVVSWQNDKGDVYAPAPVENVDYEIDWYDSGWVKADGYYYYTSAIEPGKSTSNLIDRAIQKQNCADGSYKLHIEIIAESIQAEGMGATSAQDAFTKAAE